MKFIIKRLAAVFIAVMVVFSGSGAVCSFAASADGYVTVSFEDYGVRRQQDIKDGYVDFVKPMGIIIPETKVEFRKGESIADVTMRLINKLGMSAAADGSTANKTFYFAALENFTNANYGKVASFGEFDAGPSSGWMVARNNQFINKSAAAITVENGDYIRWQYSCQLGADIGCDWSNQSAKFAGLKFGSDDVKLYPEFSKTVKNYELRVPYGTKSVSIEALMENYWSEVTYKSGSTSYKFRSDIPVSNGKVIVIESKFIPEAGKAATDSDKITLTVKIVDFSLNKQSLTLNYKKSETLIAEQSGGEKITWSSSDTKVASVDANGKVTATGKGSAVITAKTAGGKTAECNVTVKYSFLQWVIIILLFGWIWY